MIELETQFQIIFLSILFGIISAMIFSFLSTMLKNSKVIRAILELCFFPFFSIFYYYLIYLINNGVLSIYMPVFIILGIYLYKKFYDKHFSYVYDCLFKKVSSIIKIRKDRWRKLWKEVIIKKIKKPKSIE